MPSFSDLYSVYVITHYSLIRHSHMTVDAAFLYELWLGAPWGVGAPPGYTDGARWPQTAILLTTRNLWGQCPAIQLSDGMPVRKLFDTMLLRWSFRIDC